MFQTPRGTEDILPADQRHWRFVLEKASQVSALFGYQRIDTPAFEDAGLFVRSVGESTDIVEKETYTFEDRGGDALTLRAEGTAPVCRAYLQHGMHNLPQPVRLYYLCPVFRYERPQSGRNRQHHQFGIEVFGDEDATVDAEVIHVAWTYLEAVGLRDLHLSVNSIGDARCRPSYVKALRDYYLPLRERLCEDCRRRLERNPLRLLDCKRESCQPFIGNAPRSTEHLCAECEAHWSELTTHLDALGIPHEVDHRLVRGLDYYTRTVFEIAPPTEGRMTTIVGGGRYDGLIESLGGRPTPGIGFGMGLERVIANVKRLEVAVPDYRGVKVLVAHMGDRATREAVGWSARLRQAGTAAVLAPRGRGLRSQLRYATAIDATHALILGDDEIEKGVVILRDLDQGEQQELLPDQVAAALNGRS